MRDCVRYTLLLSLQLPFQKHYYYVPTLLLCTIIIIMYIHYYYVQTCVHTYMAICITVLLHSKQGEATMSILFENRVGVDSN